MTGTQKFLAIAAVASALIIAYVLVSRKDDPKTPPPDAPLSSSGIVVTPPTVVPPTPPSTSVAAPITSGAPVDIAALAAESKLITDGRAALAAGDPRKALAAIDVWEKLPEPRSLRGEAVLVKVEALTKIGRKTDALALAMRTRDDPKLASYQGRIDSVLQDAGLIGEVQTPP